MLISTAWGYSLLDQPAIRKLRRPIDPHRRPITCAPRILPRRSSAYDPYDTSIHRFPLPCNTTDVAWKTTPPWKLAWERSGSYEWSVTHLSSSKKCALRVTLMPPSLLSCRYSKGFPPQRDPERFLFHCITTHFYLGKNNDLNSSNPHYFSSSFFQYNTSAIWKVGAFEKKKKNIALPPQKITTTSTSYYRQGCFPSSLPPLYLSIFFSLSFEMIRKLVPTTTRAAWHSLVPQLCLNWSQPRRTGSAHLPRLCV